MEGNQSDEHNSQRLMCEKIDNQDQLSTLLSKARELLVSEKHFKDYEQAAELLKQALLMAQETSNKGVEAKICGELAELFFLMDSYDTSLCYGQKCLTLSKEADRKDLEALAYSCVGSAYSKLGDLRGGLECHKKSLDANSTTGDQRQKWKCLHNLGTAFTDLGDNANATKYFKESLAVATEMGDKVAIAESYGGLGVVFYKTRQYSESISHNERHLALAKEAGKKRSEAKACGNLGNVFLSKGDYTKAFARYREQCKIYKEIGDRSSEGNALGALGNVYHCRGRTRKAIESYEEQLSIANSLNDKAAQAIAIGRIGRAQHSLGENREAQKNFETLLQLTQEIGDKTNEGFAYGFLGNTHRSLGNYEEAIIMQTKFLEISRSIGDKAAEGLANVYLGSIYYSLGDFEKALQHRQVNLAINEQLGDKGGEGSSVEKLGHIYFALGNYNKAIECYKNSLSIAIAIGDKPLEGASYANLGNAFRALGMYSEAVVAIYKNAVSYAEKAGDKRMEGQMLANLGTAYNRIGDYEGELDCHRKHLSLCEDLEEKQGEATAHGNIGMVHYRMENFEEAIKHNEKQISISHSIGEIDGEMVGCLNLGKIYWKLEKLPKAIKCQKEALCFAKKMKSPDKMGSCYYDLGVSYSKLKEFEMACSYLEECTKLYAEVRQLLFEKDLYKILLSDVQASAYRLYTRCLLQQDKDEEALLVTERARSAALADMMVVSYRLHGPKDGKREVLGGGSMREVVSRVGGQVFYYALSGTGKENVFLWNLQSNRAPKFVGEVTDWKSLLDEALVEIGIDPKKREDQKSLLDDQALVEIGINLAKCEDRSLPSRENRRIRQNQEIGQEVEKVDEDLLRCLPTKRITPTDRSNALGKLYDVLFCCKSPDQEATNLIIAPDAELHRIPFAALRDENNQTLAEKHRIRVLPSLTIMKAIFDCPANYHNQKGAVIVGDPDVGSVLIKATQETVPITRLEHAYKEAKEIARMVGVNPLLGKEATKARFLEKLRTAALVHIAAHGNPGTGEIAFAPPPQKRKPVLDEEDVILTMAEVQKAEVRAKLVVLSCCHSAEGHIRAEGVIGIARAFLGAGARSVLATLWAIDDNATMEFMRNFYRHLKLGEKASEAVYQATAALRRSEEFQSPFYWAPFVLIGDDVTFENFEQM